MNDAMKLFRKTRWQLAAENNTDLSGLKPYDTTVSISTHRSISPGEGRGWVLISLQDFGPGIPQNIVDKIF